MRCQSCGYSLWNIAARECPECGTAFRPSAYEFVPGSVRFSCPHCGEAYSGRGEKGHLEPRAFPCTRCGAAVDMDQMVVRPAEGWEETDTQPGTMPWLERKQRGVVKALLATIGLAMVRPATLMRGVPQNASTGEALSFGLVATLLGLVVGGGLPFAGRALWTNVASWGGLAAFSLAELIWILLLSVFVLFMAAGSIPLWGLTAHAILRLTGSPCSVDRTLQAMSYSAGANAIMALPCAGPLVGWVWWLVSGVTMVSVAHAITRRRAALAVCALPLSILLGVAGVVGLFWWSANSMVTGGGPWPPVSQQAYGLHRALLQYAWQNNRSGPRHAIELLLTTNGWVGMAGAPGGVTFCEPGTLTTPSAIPVADGTLEDFLAMSRSERIGAVNAALQSVPDNVVAHRLGDFVLTYHGATLAGTDPELWVLVVLPDPEVNGTPAPDDMVVICTDSYTGMREIEFRELAEELKGQNAYRAELGLPPLPDPMTVTHGAPGLDQSGSPNSQEDSGGDDDL